MEDIFGSTGGTACITVVICILAAVLLACIVIFLNNRKTNRIIDSLEHMVDKAVKGTFTETRFDETKLSALETKLAEYLASSELSARNVAAEKDRIKELTSDISHQTKTPIANLLLYSELLQEEDLPEEARAYAESIYVQSEKMRFLIDSLVKLSRLEAGVFVLHPEKQKLQPLLEELEQQYRPIAEEKGLAFSIDGTKIYIKEDAEISDGASAEISGKAFDEAFGKAADGALKEKSDEDIVLNVAECLKDVVENKNLTADIEAVFDKKWTAEAVGNVIDNAIKYTEFGGITISVSAYTMFTCISVCDTGIGISEDEKAQIFGRFYRSEKVRNVEGVGVGLYLSREILSKEGGYIKVSSDGSHIAGITRESESGGARFDIFLPNA